MDQDFVDELRDFLSDRADAEYFTDGSAPVPNAAMRLLSRLAVIYPNYVVPSIATTTSDYFPDGVKIAPEIPNVI